MRLIVSVLVLGLAASAYGQLGLTESQCAGKFRQHEYKDMQGKRIVQRPAENVNERYTRLFHCGQMAVNITFLRDRSVSLCYQRPPKMSDEEWAKLSANIRASVLGQGQTWAEERKGLWWLSDKSAQCQADNQYVNLRAASIIPVAQGGTLPDTSPKAADFPFPAAQARR